MSGLRLVVLRRLYRAAYWLLRLEGILRPGRQRDGVKCLLLHGEEVLLVRHTYGPELWQLPGGGARRAESPRDVAAREMREELGVSGLEWQELSALDGPLRHLTDGSACLWAELADPTVRPEPVEIAQACWFAREALPDRAAGEVRHLLALMSGQRGSERSPGSLR
jgi:8-oxo-dGTP pyrophosphatase MutT (NUDIX family)